MAIVKIKDLTYYYPDTQKPALEKINLEIPEGQFVLVVGGSGSGKSSLVRAVAGLIPKFYGGNFEGQVYIGGKEIRQLDRRSLSQRVGILFQDPENQLVMNNVEHELAFGLENLGLPNSLMKRRVMETAGALALTEYLHSLIPELSGGQKQKVALASVLAMQPDILLLDEPTSQLDPVSGEEILTIVRRLNEENGITVVLIEQRLERCFHLADRILVMEEGRIVCDSHNPQAMAHWAAENCRSLMPPLVRLFASAGYPEIPLTVKEGRKILKSLCPATLKPAALAGKLIQAKKEEPLVDIKGLWFTYPNGKEALKNITLKIKQGDFSVLMGESGAGKTTLLKIINGLLKPSRGQVKIMGRDIQKLSIEELAPVVAYLPQNPNDYLFLPTVKEELAFNLNNLGFADSGIIEEILERLHLNSCAEANPRDLSTGERQRAALACVMAARPKLLLLDEPTRGLDYLLKEELGEILLQLQAQGTTIFVVTHDVEFAAQYANEITLMAGGAVIASGKKQEILTGSTFYSPQISRLFHNIVDGIVTFEQGIDALSRMIMEAKEKANSG